MRRIRAEEGQVFPLLLFIFFASLFVGFAVFQVGRSGVLRSDAQNAADAGAIAGARDVRDQLAQQLSTWGYQDLSKIDDGRVKAATARYVAANDGDDAHFSYERLGADVRVRVRTATTLGSDGARADRPDQRGFAQARATMGLTADGGLAAGPAIGGEATGSPTFDDKDWEDLRKKISYPPTKEDIVTLGEFLQKHGLSICCHPHWPPIGEHSTPASLHYRGQAIDANGSSDPIEAPVFDAIAPKLAGLGFGLFWRVPGHAPGDQSHMHISVGGEPAEVGTLGGGTHPFYRAPLPLGGGGDSGATVPISYNGGGFVGPGGDLSSEVHLVQWDGPPTTPLIAAQGTATPFGPPDPRIVCLITKIATDMDMTDKQLLAAYETAIVESGVKNLNYGDRDSHGVFQQQYTVSGGNGKPYWGTLAQTMDPEYSTRRFFAEVKRKDHGQPAAILAQDVQVSGRPDAYGKVEAQAVALVRQARDNKC